MPIFHFNVHDGVSLPDEEGHELDGILDAKREAVTYAAALIRELDDTFWTGEDWTMEVTDAAGMTLFSLVFAGIQAPAAGGSTR